MTIENNGNGGADPTGNEGPSLQDVLQFDPFEGTAGDPSPTSKSAEGSATDDGTSGKSGEEKPAGQEQPIEPTKVPAQAAPAPAGEPPKQVTQADLENAIRQIPDAIRAAVQPTPKAEEKPAGNKFNLGVPEPLVAALRSEDPKEFSAGIGAMINGVANHVWNAYQEHIQKELLPAVPRMIEQYVQTVQRQQAVATDFYGKYPQLQIPELAPMVQTVGAQIAQEFAQQGKSLEWGEALRDAIAERIFQRLPMLKGTPATTNGAAPPARKSFSTGTGSRPPAPASGEQNDMMEMIFGPRTH